MLSMLNMLAGIPKPRAGTGGRWGRAEEKASKWGGPLPSCSGPNRKRARRARSPAPLPAPCVRSASSRPPLAAAFAELNPRVGRSLDQLNLLLVLYRVDVILDLVPVTLGLKTSIAIPRPFHGGHQIQPLFKICQECSSLKRFFQLLPAWVLAQAGLTGPWLPGRSPALLSVGGRRDMRNLWSCTVRRPEPLEAHPAHRGARAAQRPERRNQPDKSRRWNTLQNTTR